MNASIEMSGVATPLISIEAFTEEVEDGQAVEQFVRALFSFDQGLTVTDAATPR